ncbi:MAG: LysM peptidoglycan-binding domain-containing protein [Muribaculaceae bacterium]|nr:LysM peptidoglycan-binding domain-containing protein [Muribaculaceae bacterium]
MKKFILSAVAAFCLFSSAFGVAPDLPTATIAGQKYYVYEIKKGDSLYGIANRFGWNLDVLVELNPSMQEKLQRGAKIYYPALVAASSAREEQAYEPMESYPVIRHIVKKGDTVYSIARMYEVSVDTIYEYNPSARSGVKRGEVITIPQQSDQINDGSSHFFYTIRPGDTLADIAERFNTGVEQLMRDNKGVSENNFQAGDLLRVSVNSNKNNIVTETVDETRVSFGDSYKARKDDTWESVADKTGVDVADLKEANPDVELKKNAIIAVPLIETESVEREVEATDEREGTLEGRRDIYKEVHGLAVADTLAGMEPSVSIALVIEDPSSKRDNEFTRGMFVALDRLKNYPCRISLKVLHDNHTAADSVAVVENLLGSLDDFDADVVVATHEKNFPTWLADYGEEHGAEIVNVFDVKSELYLDNPSLIHLLTPSSYFCEEVGDWVESAFPGSRLVLVGKPDADDAFADAILARMGEAGVMRKSIEDLPSLSLNDDERYLFYGYAVTKDEVASMLSAIDALKEQNPLAYVKVMGRPSWITLADGLKEQFGRNDVYFPSRFFFDHAGPDGKKFMAEYSAIYGHNPIRSFPTYAAAGYDIINYFVPAVAKNDGDFNAYLPQVSGLQTPISLQRVGNWGGFFNPSAYMIRYNPYGEIEKILITK